MVSDDYGGTINLQELDTTLQGREARSLETLSSLASLSLIFHSTRDPTPDHVSPAPDRSDGCSGGESGTDQVVSLFNVFSKSAAKPVQNLTPEPAVTIP